MPAPAPRRSPRTECQPQKKRPPRGAVSERDRRRACNLWNHGEHSHSDIAAELELPVDAVAALLEAQPGYPGIIGELRLCKRCGAQFVGPMQRFYCSKICSGRDRCDRMFERRTGRDRQTRKRRHMGFKITNADRSILRWARLTAAERGVSYETVLAEWKFEFQRPAETDGNDPKRTHGPHGDCQRR
jgi:hypothetical protein